MRGFGGVIEEQERQRRIEKVGLISCLVTDRIGKEVVGDRSCSWELARAVHTGTAVRYYRGTLMFMESERYRAFGLNDISCR